jgi:hypothetical protein
MTSTQSLLRPLAALAVAGLLAGCAGAGSAPPTSSSGALSVSQMQPLANPIEAAICKKDHGVSVMPCSVSLWASMPTAAVKTTGPKGGVFTFSDKTCSTKHIATVAGSGDKYVATWGTTSGSCSVVFTDKVKGKTVGTATLSIKNTA